MTTAHTCLNLRRRAARFDSMMILFTLLCAIAASAQAPQTPPYALLQNSTLNGTGNTLTSTYLPVVTSKGIIYVDLTVLFDVAADGTLTVSSMKQTKAATPIINGFVPGVYLGPDDSVEFITVSGPGVTVGGATEWSLAPGPKSEGCLYPSNAVWYDVGTPIKNSPIYTRLQKAGITSTQFAQYGTGAAQDNTSCQGSNWATNSLLGFAEVGGDSLVISSFTVNGKDQNTPVETKTYCLVGSPDCGTN
jgi:hypothetical protein